MTTKFTVNKLDASRTLDDVSLLVGNTKFVDLGHFIKKESKAGDANGTVTITTDLGTALNANSVLFARVAVKINGITEAVYDPNVTTISKNLRNQH